MSREHIGVDCSFFPMGSACGRCAGKRLDDKAQSSCTALDRMEGEYRDESSSAYCGIRHETTPPSITANWKGGDTGFPLFTSIICKPLSGRTRDQKC